MNELMDVRTLPHYLELLNECQEIGQTIAREAHWYFLLAKFRLGRAIVRYEEEGLIERKYGDAVIKALSEDLHTSDTVIYRAISCANYFGSERALKEFRHEYEKKHPSKHLTWTELRDHVLPQPKDNPGEHGGIEAVAQRAMSIAEKLGHELEELKGLAQNVSAETKEEIAGVIHKVQEVVNEPTFLPTAEIPRNATYLEYVRSRPCIVCGKKAEAHHLEGGGVALKGSDYLTIPLCRLHHEELHSQGRVAFQQANHVDCFYETSLCLAEYIRNNLEGRKMEGLK